MERSLMASDKKIVRVVAGGDEEATREATLFVPIKNHIISTFVLLPAPGDTIIYKSEKA